MKLKSKWKKEYNSFTASYHRTVAKRIIHSVNQAKITTDADSSVSINENNAIGVSQVSQSVRLPKIGIQKFNAQYDSWLEFRDTFSALIHNNTRCGRNYKISVPI
jgi:hypothetical protein